MFGRAIWEKLSECIFANSKFQNFQNQNFKIFKNYESDLSQKLPELRMWLLVNHTKSTNFVLKLTSFNSGQLQIIEREITKQRAVTK